MKFWAIATTLAAVSSADDGDYTGCSCFYIGSNNKSVCESIHDTFDCTS
jgi:hypothetical protein